MAKNLRKGSVGPPSMPLSDPNRPVIRLLGRLAIASKTCAARALGQQFDENRPELVVLGTGWASYNLVRQVDPTKYRVTVVSPRPYFLFTPLLTSAIGGNLSLSSIVEPIRNKLHRGMRFVKATATDIDIDKRQVLCEDETGAPLTLTFDRLAIGVGSVTNTFGIQGVKEHAQFVKEVSDAKAIRKKLFDNFNRAASPGTTPEERNRLLKIVVVGGGPAGVEVAAELNDLIRTEFAKHYPAELINKSSVTVVEMLPALLPQFSKPISEYATRFMGKIRGINTLIQHRVEKVDDTNVHLIDAKTNAKKTIEYGSLLWASGVGQTALCSRLLKKLQPSNRVLKVNPDLKVIGCERVYALGDCAMVQPPSLSDRADVLYAEAVKSSSGASANWLVHNRNRLLRLNYVQLDPKQWQRKKTLTKWSKSSNLSIEEFREMLKEIDQAYKPPIPTAQMARQAGGYLGTSLNRALSRPRLCPHLPFSPNNSGAMSYIGNNNAVISLNYRRNRPNPSAFTILGGPGSHMLWQGYYWWSQTSLYNRAVSVCDLAHSLVKGRHLRDEKAV